MATFTDNTRLYSGKGRIFYSDRTATGGVEGYVFLGNCSALNISPAVTTFTHEESQTGKNREDKSIVSSLNFGLSMVIDSTAKDTLELLLYGTTTTDTGGAVTDETFTAKHDTYISLAGGNISGTITITDDPGTTTYVENTDYEIADLANGIIKILSTGSIPDAGTIKVDYTAGATETTNPGAGVLNKEVGFLFAGLNRAEDEVPVKIKLFKVQLEPLQEWAVINDEEFLAFQVNGRILLDDLQAASTGQYMQITQVQPT